MPSLYETTAIVGDVSSSNFTTLYNSSGLSAPNTGGGAVGGNLNVSGNLTVQGTSLLQGAVTLGSTLSLPDYTFPGADGSTDQVLVTDGSGNLYWTNVTAIPGAAYTIQADTTTGGANLTLLSSSGVADPVKFAGGTNITVSRTDANTITISTTADDIPSGTAAGQVLTWDGSSWTANSRITSLAAADRLISEYVDANTSRGSSAIFRRNYGSTAYSTGLGSSISFQFDSDSQAATTQGAVGATYDAANPGIFGATSIDNFTNRTVVFVFDSNDASLAAGRLILNYDHSGAPVDNASIEVERGTETAASITWNESLDRWQVSNDLYAQGIITLDGDSIHINADSTNTDSYVNFKGINKYLRWNDALSRFEFNDSLFNSTPNEPPAQFERQTTTAATTATEMPNSLRLTERVTDAASNATDGGGTSIIFSRTSGASGGAETLYGLIGSRYYGTTNTADISFQWSSDNFTETSPGVYPNTYQLLRLGSGDAEFFNNSLYIDYTTAGAAKVGINNDTPAYTLDVTGDANITGDIYVSGYQFDINSPVAGDVVTFDGTKFVNDTTVTTTNPADRLVVQFTNTDTNRASSGQFRRNYGSTPYSAGLGSAIAFQFDSDSQPVITQGLVGTGYDAANPSIFGATSIDNFATRTIVYDIDSTDAKLAAGNLILNYDHTGTPTDNAVITVERGSSTDATITWNESSDRWEISNDLLAPQATIGVIDINRTTGQIDTNSGANLTLDSDGGTVFVNDNLNVDSGTLYVDATNNRVGINNLSPQVTLHAGGTIWGTDIVALGTVLGTNGNLIQFNNESTTPAGDCFLRVASGVSAGVSSDIKWNDTTKRWQSTVDGSTYLNLPNQNLDTTDNVTFASVTVDGGHTVIDTETTTTTSTAQTAITATSNATTRSSKFQIQVTDNVTGNIHVLEAMMFFQGTTAYLTTYAEMYNSTSLATFAADVSAGNTRLLATPASANNTTFKVTRISVAL